VVVGSPEDLANARQITRCRSAHQDSGHRELNVHTHVAIPAWRQAFWRICHISRGRPDLLNRDDRPHPGHEAVPIRHRGAERWTRNWLQREVQVRASQPGERLLAIFDVFDGWFRQPDFEGCSFINILLEVADPSDAVHQARRDHLAAIRGFVEHLAAQAGVADPLTLARQRHILRKGSIVAAAEGDHEAARRAQEVGRLLLSQKTPSPPR
jgi:hypothetical protein